MAATSSTSQLSCFSSINRKLLHLRRRSLLTPTFPTSKSWVVMSLDGRGTNTSQTTTNLSFSADETKPYVEGTTKSYANNAGEEHGVTQHKRAAKIHDFCFGIPYGGFVLGGGLLGLIFSRNLATLRTVMIGGALLALSTFSLKIWRQGKSSLPFILGQAVLSAVLFWKNYEAYTLTKKLIPAGFYAVISAAMVCFYSYVVISGGNPPPKKLKSSAVTPS